MFYLTDARDLVAAGIDGFLHLVRDQEMDAPLVQAMKERHVFVTPNLGTSEAGMYVGKPPWLDDPRLAETASPAALAKVAAVYAGRAARTAPASAEASYLRQQRSLARLNLADVPIALGDDSGIENTFFGYAEHHELELMVAAGLTPMQALVAATRTPAELLGLADLGTIAPGKPTSSCSTPIPSTTSGTPVRFWMCINGESWSTGPHCGRDGVTRRLWIGARNLLARHGGLRVSSRQQAATEIGLVVFFQIVHALRSNHQT